MYLKHEHAGTDLQKAGKPTVDNAPKPTLVTITEGLNVTNQLRSVEGLNENLLESIPRQPDEIAQKNVTKMATAPAGDMAMKAADGKDKLTSNEAQAPANITDTAGSHNTDHVHDGDSKMEPLTSTDALKTDEASVFLSISLVLYTQMKSVTDPKFFEMFVYPKHSRIIGNLNSYQELHEMYMALSKCYKNNVSVPHKNGQDNKKQGGQKKGKKQSKQADLQDHHIRPSVDITDFSCVIKKIRYVQEDKSDLSDCSVQANVPQYALVLYIQTTQKSGKHSSDLKKLDIGDTPHDKLYRQIQQTAEDVKSLKNKGDQHAIRSETEAVDAQEEKGTLDEKVDPPNRHTTSGDRVPCHRGSATEQSASCGEEAMDDLSHSTSRKLCPASVEMPPLGSLPDSHLTTDSLQESPSGMIHEDAADAAMHEDVADAASHEDATDAESHEDAADAESHEDASDAESHEDAADAASHEDAAGEASHEDAADAESHEDAADTASHEDASDAESHEDAADAVSHEDAANAASHEDAADTESHEDAADAGSHEISDMTENHAPSASSQTLSGILAEAENSLILQLNDSLSPPQSVRAHTPVIVSSPFSSGHQYDFYNDPSGPSLNFEMSVPCTDSSCYQPPRERPHAVPPEDEGGFSSIAPSGCSSTGQGPSYASQPAVFGFTFGCEPPQTVFLQMQRMPSTLTQDAGAESSHHVTSPGQNLPSQPSQAACAESTTTSRLAPPPASHVNEARDKDGGEAASSDFAPVREEPITVHAARDLPPGATHTARLDLREAANRDFALVWRRRATYDDDWPNRSGIDPANMAMAGFYRMGDGRHVRCFFCGLELDHLTAEHNIWDEHVRNGADCPYLRAVMGEELWMNTQRILHMQDNS